MDLSEINLSYLFLGFVFYLGYKQFQAFDKKLEDLKEMNAHDLKEGAKYINIRLEEIERALGIETPSEKWERWLSESAEKRERYLASPEGFFSLWEEESKAIRERWAASFC